MKQVVRAAKEPGWSVAMMRGDDDDAGDADWKWAKREDRRGVD